MGRIYIDGKLDAERIGPTKLFLQVDTNTDGIIIGRDTLRQDSTNVFTGHLDEIRIWDCGTYLFLLLFLLCSCAVARVEEEIRALQCVQLKEFRTKAEATDYSRLVLHWGFDTNETNLVKVRFRLLRGGDNNFTENCEGFRAKTIEAQG